MRREIIGILLFFLVIFSLISLVSYSPGDPSIHNITASVHVHNLFGVLGAQVSGFLIGLFGLGAFWFPVLLMVASIRMFGNQSNRTLVLTLAGGLLLIVTTGSLLALRQPAYVIFGSKFLAGGLVGAPLSAYLIRYSNLAGATIILILVWMVGFILGTGFSLIAFARRCWNGFSAVTDRIQTLWLKWKERRVKAQRRARKIRDSEPEKPSEIQIKALPVKPLPVFMNSKTS